MSAAVTEPYSASFSPTCRRDLDLQLAHPLRRSLRPPSDLRLARFGELLLALDLLLVVLGHQQRQLARQQVVARVAVGDLDDVAAAAEVVDVLSQNDFHVAWPHDS